MDAVKKQARMQAQKDAYRVEIANAPDVDAIPEYALISFLEMLKEMYYAAQK